MKKNHKNKFKTPEGYFDNFNERLMDKIIKEESLIPKEDGFALPDGYFSGLNNLIFEKLELEQPKVIQLKSYRKYYYAAASIAAIFVLGFWFSQNTNETINFEDLASAEIDAYFENNDLGLTSYELAEVVNIEEVSILDITETENSVENDMILEYLDQNIEEIDDLNLDYEDFE